MTLRLAAFAAFLAVLPLSVDAPADSVRARGQTRFEAAAGRGQYGIVTRGCNGEILDVVDRELRSGALAIEHETAAGIVIGVRGGKVRESQGARTVTDPYGGSVQYPDASLTNRYVNPTSPSRGGTSASAAAGCARNTSSPRAARAARGGT